MKRMEKWLRFRRFAVQISGYLPFWKHSKIRARMNFDLGNYFFQLPGNQAVNLIRAIHCYEEVLPAYPADDNPLIYARIQNNLGTVYSNMQTGDRNANLNRAIHCFVEALRFYTPDNSPSEYAMAQSNLGNAYSELPTGDPGINLGKAIQCYQEALRFRTPDSSPQQYALTQHNLGSAYYSIPTGDRSMNLLHAIKCFEEALRFRTPEDVPLEYAATMSNLGNAYYFLPAGNRKTNLEQAIYCYEEALRYRTFEASPMGYAETQNNLGVAYESLTTGDRSANLETAIKCYQEALRFRTPDNSPYEYAATMNNLGIAYYSIPTGDRGFYLEQALQCFSEVLHYYTPQIAPYNYADIQNNLGVIYFNLPKGERELNLAQAIRHYEAALRIRTADKTPNEYAITQNNMGNAFYALQTGDRKENIARAIQCYEEALRFRRPDINPYEYAATQNNLGVLYLEYPVGDRAENLKRAIKHFQEALRFRTVTIMPREYAAIQHNLGTAYYYLPVGDRENNLEQAIKFYHEALRYRSADTMSYEYAATQNNLGLAYLGFPADDHEENLDRAISCFKEALKYRSPDITPREYAETQNNIGSAYANRTTEEFEDNLKRAIDSYQAALQFYTFESTPYDYASIQNNLGMVYSKQIIDHHDANLAKAIRCFKDSLRINTLNNKPHRNRQVNRNLANLYFDQEQWAEALQTYQAAMEAGERLYRAGLSTESKSLETGENAICYRNAAFAAARMGDVTTALLTLEQGKTRILSEMLRLKVSRPEGVPDDAWLNFERAGSAIRATQTETPAVANQNDDPMSAYTVRERTIREANAALDSTIAEIRRFHPDFLKTLNLPDMLSLLPNEHTALITFCFTKKGSISFIVSHHCSQPVKMIDIPNFTTHTLQVLIREKWLETYWRNRDSLFSAMDQLLVEVGEQLLAPILTELDPSIDHLLFIPSGGLYLIPLHAVPVSNGDARLCERFRVSYAPSVAVLSNFQQKITRKFDDNLLAVINPREDLPFAVTEGLAISNLFVKHCIYWGRHGTKESIMNEVSGRSYLHFSCHGRYDWDNPPESHLLLADGNLTLAELQNGMIDMSAARLVTLSACETGIIDILKGNPEEYAGLPAGFMLSGVPCVISSLWKVPDLSTALLMERFYRNHIENKHDFVTSLQEAQLWLRSLPAGQVIEYIDSCKAIGVNEKNDEQYDFYYCKAQEEPNYPIFEHPYYWAAFFVNGM